MKEKNIEQGLMKLCSEFQIKKRKVIGPGSLGKGQGVLVGLGTNITTKKKCSTRKGQAGDMLI